MVIRPAIGGGWHKICVCQHEIDAKKIVEAVNLMNEG